MPQRPPRALRYPSMIASHVSSPVPFGRDKRNALKTATGFTKNGRVDDVEELRCPNDNKKLADVQNDYFDTPGEKNKFRNKGKLFIKCPKCKQSIGF